MTNLTALLVLTTVFIATSNSLPKTAYIKLIEVWLLGHLFVPFFEVILHSIIDFIREELNHKEQAKVFTRRNNLKDERYNHLSGTKVVLRAIIAIGRYGFPTIYFIFCSFFAIYGVAAN